MKNSVQLVFNAVVLVAVAVLYFLHFTTRSALPTVPAAKTVAVEETAPAAAAPVDTAAVPAAAADPMPAATGATAPSAGTIVYIESSKLLDGYQGMKDARKSFETKARGWDSQNKALINGFQTAVQQYQKTAASLTPEQRAAAEQKLQQQQQEGAVAQRKLQEQAQEAESKLTQTVLESVNKKVEAFGKAHGYQLILIATPNATVAYGDKSLDVTTPVMAYLNSEYRKK
ncbi:MAG: OmpH family outer membrane protein [Janthinobacterium lividum]